MARFAAISNGQYTNMYDSEVRLTVVGATTGEDDKSVELYSTVFPVPSGQFSISLDPVLGKTKTLNDIMNKRGFLGGTTSGEVQLTEKTTSITLKTDYVFLSATKKGIELSKNVLDALIKGEGFVNSAGKYVKVLGTNGTVKHGFNTRTNKFFGKLFELDGRLIIADAATESGDAITVGNIRKGAYDKTCNYMILEIISKFDDETADGLRLVYTMNSDVSWSDATDANEITFTNTQLCDARMVEKFFIEGWDTDGEAGVNVPARRVQFAKNAVAAFKATAKLAEDTGDVLGENEGVLTAGTSFDVPEKVIVGDLAKGEFKAEDYTPTVGDIAVLYIPSGDSTTRDPGYALAKCTTSGASEETWDDVGVAGFGLAEDAAYNSTSITFTGDELLDPTPLLEVGDVITLTGQGVTELRLEVSDIAPDTDPANTTVTFTSEIGVNLTDTGEDMTIKKLDTTETAAEFQLVVNDYRLGEKGVFGPQPAYDDACDVIPVNADTVEKALITINEWNFEESRFEKIAEGTSC